MQVKELWNSSEVFKLSNNTTLVASIGLLVFAAASYLLEKVFALNILSEKLVSVNLIGYRTFY